MRENSRSLPRIALLGGSFNPPHTGHFRIALEVWEALRPERLLFIPCAVPPHKPSGNLLPFDLRVGMIEQALADFPGMEVCPIEGERSGPSYTVDTLSELAQQFPESRLTFIMGGEDFPQLSTWRCWERIPSLADIIVLPRGGKDRRHFEETARSLWPGLLLEAEGEVRQGQTCFRLPGGSLLFYLEQPCLDIRSSMLRQRWLEGRSLNFLTPDAVVAALEADRNFIRERWLRG